MAEQKTDLFNKLISTWIDVEAIKRMNEVSVGVADQRRPDTVEVSQNPNPQGTGQAAQSAASPWNLANMPMWAKVGAGVLGAIALVYGVNQMMK